MNPVFGMRWAHAHHGAARMHDRDRHEIHEGLLRTLGVVVLVGTVVILAMVAMVLHPNWTAGTGYISNQFDISHTFAPWGTPYYDQYSTPLLPYRPVDVSSQAK